MANLSISNAWDDARPIIARDGKLMFMVALVTVVLPGTFLMLMSPEQGMGGTVEVGEGGAMYAILTLIFAFVGVVGSIAISYLALFRGASVGDSLRRGFKRLPTVIGMILLFMVPAIIIALVLAVAFIGVDRLEMMDDPETVSGLGGGAVIAMLLFIIGMIYVSVRLMLTTPVIAARDVGPIKVITDSWQLTKGHFWRLLGFLMLFVVSLLVLMILVGIVAGLIVTLLFGDIEAYSVAALIMGLFSTLAQAAVTIVYSTIIARIYHQLAGNPADPAMPSVPPTA